MGALGTELSRNSAEKQEVLKPRGTISGTIPDDPALQSLIDAWPTLSAAMRAGIVAMVRATGGK